MHAVNNASSLFIDDGDGGGEWGGQQSAAMATGPAVLGVSMLGNRPVMLEVQVKEGGGEWGRRGLVCR